jgi:hypothetical protein
VGGPAFDALFSAIRAEKLPRLRPTSFALKSKLVVRDDPRGVGEERGVPRDPGESGSVSNTPLDMAALIDSRRARPVGLRFAIAESQTRIELRRRRTSRRLRPVFCGVLSSASSPARRFCK